MRGIAAQIRQSDRNVDLHHRSHHQDGTIAGPKILEHIVDVVLQFEGDNNLIYRILRGIKNRFGATFEIGVFEMLDAGLREVDNPSEILLSHYETPLSGIAVGASVDASAPT